MVLAKTIKEQKDIALLLVRVAVGLIFIVHGYQKLQMGFGAVTGFLGNIGVPLSQFFGYVLPLVEFIGGLFLIFGFLSRLSALLLSIVMVVAILLVKLKIGLVAPMGQPGVGAELDLALLVGLLSVLLQGPGKYSIDLSLVKKEIC
ncbi:MAG: hypothetical protein KatS3mg095_0212 [Candidatus Parcubacteria bacterium]|nr:MAG: hypothetical protein KatS3mg095_0212 [Candidatus Parcubacteria bacterium]